MRQAPKTRSGWRGVSLICLREKPKRERHARLGSSPLQPEPVVGLTRTTTRSAPLLAFVLRDPRLHQFLDKGNRQGLVHGELNGPFGCGEALEFAPKLFDN